jgi:hypothetical protein
VLLLVRVQDRALLMYVMAPTLYSFLGYNLEAVTPTATTLLLSVEGLAAMPAPLNHSAVAALAAQWVALDEQVMSIPRCNPSCNVAYVERPWAPAWIAKCVRASILLPPPIMRDFGRACCGHVPGGCCRVVCSHATCVATNLCSCRDGYSGPQCMSPPPAPPPTPHHWG